LKKRGIRTERRRFKAEELCGRASCSVKNGRPKSKIEKYLGGRVKACVGEERKKKQETVGALGDIRRFVWEIRWGGLSRTGQARWMSLFSSTVAKFSRSIHRIEEEKERKRGKRDEA
jgi:hypothetical protein